MMSTNRSNRSDDRLLPWGGIVILLVIALCGWGAYRLFFPEGEQGSERTTTGETSPARASSYVPSAQIGIAYGSEKKSWLEWAATEFAMSEVGGKIRIKLIPMGSLEGAQALVSGDRRINVWSPASSLYKPLFIEEWQRKYSKPPILTEQSLARTPMVFVVWRDRYDVFKERYGELSFATLALALGEPKGREAIGGKREWGAFKFAHTIPSESNSGLATLVTMAYGRAGKTSDLSEKDALDPQFQKDLTSMEKRSSLVSGTGDLMREMVHKGPTAYDAVFVYESVAIDYLKSTGHFGPLQVVYPKQNLWNDNPYYIIDAPWSSADQRKAAEVFLRFLMSDPIQKQALVHGFRPGNANVPVIFPASPFVLFRQYGLRNEIENTCDYPSAEVLKDLLAVWQRAH